MPKGVFVTSTKTPFSWGTSGKAVQLAKDLIGGYIKISGQLVRLNSQSSMLLDDPSDMDEEIDIDIEDEPEKRPAPRPIVPFFFSTSKRGHQERNFCRSKNFLDHLI